MPGKTDDDNLSGETADISGVTGDMNTPDEISMPVDPDAIPEPEVVQRSAPKPSTQIIRLTRSIGMVMPSNRVRKFLGRGAIPPVNERKHFVARLKHLDRIEVLIVEGDEEQADQNVVVGEVGLSNIRLREDGRAEIEVDFALDEKGMLIVTVADRLSNVDCFARFILPQFSSEQVESDQVSKIPVGELSKKIELLEEQMQLLKGELAVRRERDKT